MNQDEEIPSYNFTSSSEDVMNQFESFLSKQAKKLPKKDVERLQKILNRLAKNVAQEEVKPVVQDSMKERYQKAWKVVYKKQHGWRQKEIDNSLKDGTFGIKGWDDDFVRQVTELAESDKDLS